MRRLTLPVLLLVLATVAGRADVSARAAPSSRSADAEADEVDYVTLAAVLIGDGHYDRALVVLRDVTDEQLAEEDFDRPRFFTLRGLAHQAVGDDEAALADFDAALDAGQQDRLVHLYAAQSHFALEQFSDAVRRIDLAGEGGRAVPGSWMLKARAYRKLGRDGEAWRALHAGRRRFPDDIQFLREQLFLLIELQLYVAARDTGRVYLERQSDEPEAWMAVGEAFRQSGNLERATTVLEEARLRFPAEVQVHTLLAQTYLDRDQPLSAASVLQGAAELDPALTTQAAESFRKAGALHRALYMNQYVRDPVDKARQRLGLLIEAQTWDRAIALTPRLERLGLLEEDPVAYAVAYAWFQVGQLELAEEALKFIDDPGWFRDATALRKAMASCEPTGWGCQ